MDKEENRPLPDEPKDAKMVPDQPSLDHPEEENNQEEEEPVNKS